MHKLRSFATRRGLGVHFVRLATLSAALTALTALLVADVTAAESDELVALSLVDGDPGELDATLGAPRLLALVVPDAVAPSPTTPQLLIDIAQEKPKKPRRRSKLKFGRFEGY